jgi:uncharacterized protein
MRTAIILHGKPSKEEYFDPASPSPSNAHWLPWLQRQLLLEGVLAQTPELPEPYAPNYRRWSAVFERFPVDAETMLVGHSCGAGFLVRWLGEHKVEAGKVALVAPWIDPTGARARAMFDGLYIDPGLAARTGGVRLFISGDDSEEVLASAAQLELTLKGIEIKRFSGHGHFTSWSMKSGEFPELRDFLIP